MIRQTDEYYMREALKEAQKAYDKNEVPIGAVIVFGNRIIARAHNMAERLNDATAHAEMQAFTAAAEFLGSKYLNECSLYVTIEPCVMCAGAAFWTQVGRIVYGAADDKRGYSLLPVNILHPATAVKTGVLENECSGMVKRFFLDRR